MAIAAICLAGDKHQPAGKRPNVGGTKRCSVSDNSKIVCREHVIEAWCLLPDQRFDIDPDPGLLLLAALHDVVCRSFDDKDQIIPGHTFIGAEQDEIGTVIAAGDIDMTVGQVGNQTGRCRLRCLSMQDQCDKSRCQNCTKPDHRSSSTDSRSSGRTTRS